MTDHYKEKAFESAIENYMLTEAGYIKGDKDSFDPQRGLDPTVLLDFIQETQPKFFDMLVCMWIYSCCHELS